MTKVLHVTGADEDYGALTFERSRFFSDLPKTWETVMESGGEDVELVTSEANYIISAYEFGEVDKNFIEFVKSIQDYDHSKHENFYIVE